MHGSDEEVDEPLEVDSDEDCSDGEKQLHEEVECAQLLLVDKSLVQIEFTLVTWSFVFIS